MTKHSLFGMTVIVSVVAILFWSTHSLRATQQATATPPVCVMPGPTNAYGPGAAVVQNGQTYRCVYIYGQQLTPAGVAWVKIVPMTPQTASGLIQEPAGR